MFFAAAAAVPGADAACALEQRRGRVAHRFLPAPQRIRARGVHPDVVPPGRMSATLEFSGIRLRPMQEEDQPRVLEWRSDPAISQLMYTDVKGSSLQEQLAWFR